MSAYLELHLVKQKQTQEQTNKKTPSSASNQQKDILCKTSDCVKMYCRTPHMCIYFTNFLHDCQLLTRRQQILFKA